MRIDVHVHLHLEGALLSDLRYLFLQLNRKADTIMTNVTELAGKLDAIGAQLDKAQAEILAEIQTLKDSLGQIGSEAESSLARLTQKVQALDDLNPDAPAAATNQAS